MTQDGKRNDQEMRRLFDLELRYDRGASECAPLGPREGQLFGSGAGKVEGKIRGTVRWSNYERTLEPGLCLLQIPGVIETEEGVSILFEARGHAFTPSKEQPERWRSAGAVRFRAENKRYQWLNSVPAVWEGDFDMKTFEAHYRVYTTDEGNGADR